MRGRGPPGPALQVTRPCRPWKERRPHARETAVAASRLRVGRHPNVLTDRAPPVAATGEAGNSVLPPCDSAQWQHARWCIKIVLPRSSIREPGAARQRCQANHKSPLHEPICRRVPGSPRRCTRSPRTARRQARRAPAWGQSHCREGGPPEQVRLVRHAEVGYGNDCCIFDPLAGECGRG